jgi:predicted nucleic acid-binding protein
LILDTNALSAFVDGHPEVIDILRDQPRAAVPAVVLGEFRCGIAQSRQRAACESWPDVHVHGIDVLAITAETSLSYARVRLALGSTGQPIPANDAWIAALALQHGMPVLGRDPHFDAVPAIERRAW